MNLMFAVIFLTGLLLGSFIGITYGVDMAVDKAVKIIPIFANITIDKQAVNDALFRYNNNLGGNEKCIYISQPKE